MREKTDPERKTPSSTSPEEEQKREDTPHRNGGEDRTTAIAKPVHSFSRRSFLTQVGTIGIAATAAPLLHLTESHAAAPAVVVDEPAPVVVPGAVPIVLNVNGHESRLVIEPRVTLLDALREELHLPGTKKGCDHGQCGACTVHVNGRRVNSCLTFAVMHQGDQITTIEGLGKNGELHPVQTAFLEHDGFQCGYCTSGQIMSAAALLNEPCGKEDDDVRECMSGNICRCGAYNNILAAVQMARRGVAVTSKE